jgi:hypothetical protein
MAPTRKELRKQAREEKKHAKVEHFKAKGSQNSNQGGAGGGRLSQLANNIKQKQVQQSQQVQQQKQQQTKPPAQKVKTPVKGVVFDERRNSIQEFDKTKPVSTVSMNEKKRLASGSSKTEQPASKKISKLAQMAAALGHDNGDDDEYDSEEGDLHEPVDIDEDDEGTCATGCIGAYIPFDVSCYVVVLLYFLLLTLRVSVCLSLLPVQISKRTQIRTSRRRTGRLGD